MYKRRRLHLDRMAKRPRHAAAVVARNYLPHVRVLARSLATHHPSARLVVLLVDGAADDRMREEPFELLLPADVGVDDADLHRRAMLYRRQGVISSLRPRLVRHLRETRGGSVLLIDADMEAYAPLDDLWRLAERHAVVLSPHSIDPLPGAPGAWPEEAFLRAGTFNGGLLGVGPAGDDFLAWLIPRVDHDCVLDPSRGLLFSQTWLNLVPALFDHAVIHDRGVNAMVHNLRHTDLRWRGDRAFVGDTPVRLFHFAGFDPAQPEQLCRYFPGEAFAEFGNRPGLRRLAAEYAERLRAEGWPAAPTERWSAFANGTPVDDASRAIFREADLAAANGAGPPPPDPFAPGDAFVAWLHERDAHGLSRYLRGLHLARPDLQTAFPGVPEGDVADYLAWARVPEHVGPPFAPTD